MAIKLSELDKEIKKPIKLSELNTEKPKAFLPYYKPMRLSELEKEKNNENDKILSLPLANGNGRLAERQAYALKQTQQEDKVETVKKQSLPMKAIEYVNNLGYKTGKSLMELGDVAAYNVLQNSVDNAKLIENTNKMAREKLGINISTPKYAENIINKYENISPTSRLTQSIKNQEDASTARLKAGNNDIENTITDIALAGGDMAIKAIPSLATGLPLMPLTIGLSGYADTFHNDMQNGISRDKARLHALGSGAISGGIESITGIGASGASKALASKAGQKILSIVPKKVASYISKASNSIIGGIFKNAIGEGFEEGLEYDVQRIYQNLVLDENTPRDIKEQAYSMMIGGAVGGLFGGGKALLNKKPSLPYYKPTENKTPSLPNINKTNMVNGEQTFESKIIPNNVDIDNGNVISQEEIKEPLKSNLEWKTEEEYQKVKPFIENEYNNSVDKNLVNFINYAKENKSDSKFNYDLSDVNEKQVNDILNLTGIDTTDYTHNIKADSIRHIDFRHGENGQQDTSMKNIEDIARLGYIIDNYDSVELLDKKSSGFINADGKASDLIRYKKRINGSYYLVEAVPDTKKKKLQVVSAYIDTNKNKVGQTPNDNISLGTTSKNDFANTTLNNKISQGNSNVNNISQIMQEKYAKRKELKKIYDNAVKNGSLTDTEKHFLDGLVKGTITFNDLPNTVRKANIQALYDVKKPLDDIDRIINNTKKEIKSTYRQLASDLIQNSDTWKDKSTGLQYQRETMERNFRDIIPDSKEAEKINDTYFTKIHENEALSTKSKNEYRDKIKVLKLGDKDKYKVTFRKTKQGLPIFDNVSERALVQLLGEGKINEEAVKSSGADVQKIKSAVQTFRGIYNDLINQANDSLIRNGYAPVDYRQDYFPHFTEDTVDNLLGSIAKKLGFNINTSELPTDIAGLTHTFKPGKKWVGNFKQRLGKQTDYDAVQGFDRYIEGVSDVIHHTDDIQRLRALENEIRYKYSSDGIKAEIDTLNANEDISVEDRQNRINELFERDKSKFPHLVTELRNYTDTLAGKKNINDRNMEHRLGRGMYEVAKAMENRVASNMVALNPGSWITNFIPLTQALGGVKATNLLNAMKDTVSSTIKSDGMADKSTFLINRRGSEPLVKTGVQKVSSVLVSPMQWIDNFTSESLVRARYYENMRNGISEAEAMQDADKWTAGLMADRSKGALPTIFNEKNPLMKLFTMFQVEVNNQLGFYFKDVPRDLKGKGVAAIAGEFMQMFLGAWAYNELYEKLTGRRSAFDPIDIIKTAYDDFTDEDKKKGQAVLDTGVNILQELPFVGTLIDGGRVPMSSAFPSLPNLVNAGIGLATGEMNSKKALSVLGKEIAKPAYYMALPFAGGQTKKVVETIDVMKKGGSYGVDSQGRDMLQFPVEPTMPNMLKSATFGKYSLPGAKEYVDGGFKSLGGPITEKYKKAKEHGITHEEFITAYKAFNSAESDKDKNGKTINLSLSKNKVKAIKNALSNTDYKKLRYLFKLFEISESVWK